MEIWSGFFGIDEDGNQPECGTHIRIEVEEESVVWGKDGPYPCYDIECPKCKGLLDSAYTEWIEC